MLEHDSLEIKGPKGFNPSLTNGPISLPNSTNSVKVPNFLMEQTCWEKRFTKVFLWIFSSCRLVSDGSLFTVLLSFTIKMGSKLWSKPLLGTLTKSLGVIIDWSYLMNLGLDFWTQYWLMVWKDEESIVRSSGFKTEALSLIEPDWWIPDAWLLVNGLIKAETWLISDIRPFFFLAFLTIADSAMRLCCKGVYWWCWGVWKSGLAV